MAVPLDKIRSEHQVLAAISTRLDQLASVMKKLHDRWIANRFDKFTQRQEQKAREGANKGPSFHFSSSGYPG
jgi:hypothetical protein